jgi:hypothetical protein
LQAGQVDVDHGATKLNDRMRVNVPPLAGVISAGGLGLDVRLRTSNRSLKQSTPKEALPGSLEETYGFDRRRP